jgi:uncharacterized protein (DUF1778 family)
MSKDKENKTVNINLRVSEATKKELVKLAEVDRRSLSDFIRLQMEKLVDHKRK